MTLNFFMTFIIEKLKENDRETVVDLYYRIVDELHSENPEVDRSHFRNIYTPEKIKKRINDKNCVYLVGKENGNLIGFVFAWISQQIGNIFWLGIAPSHRRKGYGSKLLEETLNIFANRDCYKAKIFTYPSEKLAYHLFQKHGFKETARIGKSFFGVGVVLMVKKITPVPDEYRTKKIILAGEAGQGIKLMAHILASILTKLGKEVALNLVYDAAVRGGNIKAEITYSDEPIEVPFFEEADIGLLLSRIHDTTIKAKHILIESSACGTECKKCDLHCPASNRIPFEKIATQHFSSPIFVNMIALGKLLQKIGINIELVNFDTVFPAQFFDENIRAIRYGYTYQD
ncbi:MAG: GNAT family N-acetyltransferase [Candidatus Kuenenia sp.]|nr:GNAT family N-acetyltransferase [Candidatus Kuenenia hertensis]